MSEPQQQIVLFAVTLILVVLFGWIYLRDRQERTGLWMLGWLAILIHFGASVLAGFGLIPQTPASWTEIATMEVAGVCFFVSVSEVFAGERRRRIFFLLVALPSLFYTTAFFFHVERNWIYGLLLTLSVAAALGNVIVYYRKGLYLYLVLATVLPYSAWSVQQIWSGKPQAGLSFFLSVLFGAAGVHFWRHHHRYTPGVITTAAAFLGWAAVFPVSLALDTFSVGLPGHSVLLDIPQYFVAFGMILTLLENQTQVAQDVARQYQDLFEGNLAAVYVSTFEGKILDCNTGFATMFGFESKQELLNSPAVSLYQDPEDRRRFMEILKRQGQVLDYECPQRRKDGSTFWILERTSVATDASGTKVIKGTAIDITERKQAAMALAESEERFSTIFSHSPIGYCLCSTDGTFLNVNETMAFALGHPRAQIIGKTSVDLGVWKSKEARAEFYRRLRSEGAIRDLKVTLRGRDGVKRPGLLFAHLVLQGDKEYIFGIYVDRSEQLELEARLLQSQKMEALGQLAGGVAHDFNNMLGVIGSYAELLDSRLGLGSSYSRYCSKIIETTQRAAGLTRQLLTFSRKEITQPLPVRPDREIRELASLLPQLIGKDVEMHLDLRSRGTVVIDRTHFEQIIFNIVVNARDAMPAGGQLFLETEDRVRTTLGSGESVTSEFVEIRVRDTGAGMDEQVRLRAFEPFFTTKPAGRGTGLGLSTVYGIVQQSSGEITLKSQKGKGTQISILLPVASGVEPVFSSHSAGELKPGSANILLVEDELELLNANAEFLGSLGYTVVCATNGPDALKVAETDVTLDLVISDIVMPRMSGREFAGRLLHIRPDIKLLLVSGYSGDDVPQSGISTLRVPFLQKPFTLKQLGTKVQELLSAPAD